MTVFAAILGIHKTCLRRHIIIKNEAIYRKCVNLELCSYERHGFIGGTKGSRHPHPPPFKLALTQEKMLFYLAGTDPTIEMRSRGDGVGGILPSSSALIAPIRGTLILRI